MKNPYVSQFERKLITEGTLTGACIMLRFRCIQFLKEIIKQLNSVVKY